MHQLDSNWKQKLKGSGIENIRMFTSEGFKEINRINILKNIYHLPIHIICEAWKNRFV